MRVILRCLVLLGSLFSMSAEASPNVKSLSCQATWPLWNSFVTDFIQADGRVIDASTVYNHSTSESQSYAMMFALIANDQEQFKRVWQWTQRNLMGSDIQKNLPAWQWGRSKEGEWRIIDKNAASDADLWIVYALFEAARAWRNDAYKQDALTMLRLIKERETAYLPEVGSVIMPGVWGYVRGDTFKLNPSYWPLPVLRRMAIEDPSGPWAEMANTHVALIAGMSPKGFAPDWVLYQKDSQGKYGFATDNETTAIGSYDAIRVYLWAGMTPPNDPLANPLLKAVAGYKPYMMTGHVPEKVDVLTGQGMGDAPNGFYGALLPYYARIKGSDTASNQAFLGMINSVKVRMQNERLKAYASKQQPVYYDNVLILFGLGWTEKYYRFLPDGKMQFKWEVEC